VTSVTREPRAANRVHGARPEGAQDPRRSLVLAGGGMRVAYQAGVIHALIEAGLCFDHADGTSGGTINLAMLFSGLSSLEMCERWRTLDVKDFVSLLPVHEYLKAPSLPAMGDADGLVTKVFPHLGVDIIKINAAVGMDGTFNVCNFRTKTNEVVPHNVATLSHLVAGVSLPIFMPAVRIGDDFYTDSVWIKDANVAEAMRRGAEEIWLVWCIGNTPEYHNGAFQQYVHMIEMSANGALFADLERVAELNERIRRGESPYGHTRPIVVHVIKPKIPLPLDPDYYLGKIHGDTLVGLGYADACEALARVQAGDPASPLDPSATQMLSGKPGVSFREEQDGRFVTGAHDAARVRDDKYVGDPMRMRTSVFVHDLARFQGEPSHGADVVAMLDIPGVGSDIMTRRGRLDLTKAAATRGGTKLHYQLPFVRDGQPYLFEAWKELRDDPGPDMIADMTTTFVRLHRGRAVTDPIVGVGVLETSPARLLAMSKDIHAIHCNSLATAATTVKTFARAWLRALFEEYVRPRRPWWKFWAR